MRLSASYTTKEFTVGGMYQTYDQGTDSYKKVNTLLLSGAYNIAPKSVIKAQVVQTKQDQRKVNQMTVGYDYNFTGMTKAFAAASQIKPTDAMGNSQDSTTLLVLGMQTKF